VRKGILELCEAFRRLARSRQDVRLQVLGAGALERRLKEEFADCRQIEFLGFRDWDEIAPAYAAADLLCAPSHHDGWGLIVPEAMASGLPVIASDQMGSSRELVVEGRTGWLIRPRSVSILEERLRSVLELPSAALEPVRRHCREIAREYDLRAGAARFLAAAAASVNDWAT